MENAQSVKKRKESKAKRKEEVKALSKGNALTN